MKIIFFWALSDYSKYHKNNPNIYIILEMFSYIEYTFSVKILIKCILCCYYFMCLKTGIDILLHFFYFNSLHNYKYIRCVLFKPLNFFIYWLILMILFFVVKYTENIFQSFCNSKLWPTMTIFLVRKLGNYYYEFF